MENASVKKKNKAASFNVAVVCPSLPDALLFELHSKEVD